MASLPPIERFFLSDNGFFLSRRQLLTGAGGALAAAGAGALITSPAQADPVSAYSMDELADLGKFHSLKLTPTLKLKRSLDVRDNEWYQPRTEAMHLDARKHLMNGIPFYWDGSAYVCHPTWATTVIRDWLGIYQMSGVKQWLQWAVDAINGLVAWSAEVSTKLGPALLVPYETDRTVKFATRSFIEKRPWYSSFGNSRMIQCLTRLYALTGDSSWADLARKYVRGFAVTFDADNPKAPWLSAVDEDSYLWFESCASDSGWNTRIINTLPSAIAGLHHYVELVDPHPLVTRLLYGGYATMDMLVDRVRRPGRVSRYFDIDEVYEVPSYHRANIDSFVSMYLATGHRRYFQPVEGLLRDWSANQGRTWASDSSGQAHPLRVVARETQIVRYRRPSGSLAPAKEWYPRENFVVETSSRSGIANNGIWSLMSTGPYQGYWIKERPGAAFQMPSHRGRYLSSRDLDVERPDFIELGHRPIPIRAASGVSLTSGIYDYSGARTWSAQRTLSEPGEWLADGMAFINGDLSVRLKTGPLAPGWIKLDDDVIVAV